jgi:hypothetical protein
MSIPDLLRRIDRKLDIQRGMTLTYDDLALFVASGATLDLGITSQTVGSLSGAGDITSTVTMVRDP